MNFNTVSVIGLGYIGLPTAAVMASRGLSVIGVDINQKTVDTINRGEIHIIEPGLESVVNATVKAGSLRAYTSPRAAEAFIIAVPTPFIGEERRPDLRFVQAAANSIAPVLSKGNLVILESTSPVGTTELMADWLAKARPDLTFPQTHGDDADVRIAHCPERVLPGQVMTELITNDRIIGGLSANCSAKASQLYKVFVEGNCVVTSARVAEMCKLTENSFRDVNIAFANELSLICDRIGVDVWELIRLANRHPRVKILQPGAGVGGHCIAVDPWFIVHQTPDLARLIRTARQVNDSKPHWVIEKVKAEIRSLAHATRLEENVTVAILGLAFKADIDDLRESPALDIAVHLVEELKSNIVIVEPNIECLPDSLLSVRKVTLEEARAQADLLVVLVAHREFKSLTNSAGESPRIFSAVELRA